MLRGLFSEDTILAWAPLTIFPTSSSVVSSLSPDVAPFARTGHQQLPSSKPVHGPPLPLAAPPGSSD